MKWVSICEYEWVSLIMWVICEFECESDQWVSICVYAERNQVL